MSKLLTAIERAIRLGYTVELEGVPFSQLQITVRRFNNKERFKYQQQLPMRDDHFSDDRIGDCIDYMTTTLISTEVKSKA